jgi:hypothetical protein
MNTKNNNMFSDDSDYEVDPVENAKFLKELCAEEDLLWHCLHDYGDDSGDDNDA